MACPSGGKHDWVWDDSVGSEGGWRCTKCGSRIPDQT